MTKHYIMTMLLLCSSFMMKSMMREAHEEVISEWVDISGIDKIALVKALWSEAGLIFPLQRGALTGPLSDIEARHALYQFNEPDAGEELHARVDHLSGRLLCIVITENLLFAAGYNKVNGPGAAESVVQSLKAARGLEIAYFSRAQKAGV